MTKIQRRVTGKHLGSQICEALGVDPSNVSKVVLTAEYNDLAYVDITMIPLEDEGEAIAMKLAEHFTPRYRIVPHSQVDGHFIIEDTMTGFYCGLIKESPELLQDTLLRMNSWGRL